MNGARALPPSKDTITRESQSPCLALHKNGLEGDAVPVHKLTFCCHSGLSLAGSAPIGLQDQPLPSPGQRGGKVEGPNCSPGADSVEWED